jgi:hypothetical protein
VDALRKLHDTLEPEGMLVDTQPLSPRPPVRAEGEWLGTLDMREWARTIGTVDEQVGRALDEGLFEVTDERRYVVTDVFDTGDEFVDEVSKWDGTRISPRVAAKIRRAAGPVSVDEDVRLRLLGPRHSSTSARRRP